MNTLKKIALIFVVIIALSLVGGHFYFDRKFTPPDNYLTVSLFAENVAIKWDVNDSNPYSTLFLPVRINGINKLFYMQLDFGSPITIFYSKSLASLQSQIKNHLKPDTIQKQIALDFSIGTLKVASKTFTLLNYGDTLNFENPDALNVIGTIGTDLLEKRVTVLDFKNKTCSFVDKLQQKGFEDFEFKKRRIIIPAAIDNQVLKLLYDSGSSNYELITNKEEWKKYKTPNGKTKIDKGNSWGNQLKVVSAPANHTIKIGNTALHLSEVTYVEGTSTMQNLLMKSSGMQGMIGNKLFLNHKLTLDCKHEKFKIE